MFERLSSPRFMVTVDGMDHGFSPRKSANKMIVRATAFLNWIVKGNERYKEYLVADGDGVTVKALTVDR